MDYKEMTRRLRAASREMRQYVPHLKFMDDILERMQAQWEDVIWNGTTTIR